jgi:hypothetical protein
VTGNFIWFAAGGSWRSFIRTAAPASAAIGVEYLFFDEQGSRVSVDTDSGAARTSSDTVSLVLNPNQPSELELLGAGADAPQYGRTQTGSVFGIFLCPDAVTCALLAPQLLFSYSPLKPWSLSAPIAWDKSFSSLQPSGLSARWSTAGINDPTHILSFAIYNQSPRAATYTIRVYDSNGSVAGEGATPVIGQAQTRGFLLTDVIRTALPSGILKIAVEGTDLSSVLFLQFSGDSATSLQATSEALPGGVLRTALPQ